MEKKASARVGEILPRVLEIMGLDDKFEEARLVQGWAEVVGAYQSEHNSSRLSSYLLEEARVAVVPGIAFGSDLHIRLSFATSDQNIIEGVRRIDEAVRKLA